MAEFNGGGIKNDMIEDEIFNQLVKLDVLDYEEAKYPHECSICGETSEKTYRHRFIDEGDKDLCDSTPYLFICEDCYLDAREGY